MGYPRDLDDYTDQELFSELARRTKARKAGLCDYCNRRKTEPTCLYPDRHKGQVS